MRPGCDRSAAARLAFDPIALQLWLDPLGPRSAPVQELCEFHVERLTIPRGWSATDRRPGPTVSEIEPVAVRTLPVGQEPRTSPELEPVVAPEPAVAVEPVVVPEPAVAVEPAAALEPEPAPEPDPPEPAVAGPVEDRPRRPPRKRAATRTDSPLLGRAFAWTGPQQSILTQRSAADAEATGDEPGE